MKQSFVFALAMAFVTACSTAPHRQNHTSSESSPETVLVTYRVKPGKEQQLAATLSRAWDVYRKERLVFAQPHVIIREREEGDKHRFIEMFTWVSHDAPDHAPDSVKNIWDQMQLVCETRDGHKGLEGGEVEILVPKASN